MSRCQHTGNAWFFSALGFFLGVAVGFPAAGEAVAKKYCELGRDPVDRNYRLAENEEIEVSRGDILVRMKGGSGRVSECWVKAGTEFVVGKSDSERKALKLNICANPILNDVFFPRNDRYSRREPMPDIIETNVVQSSEEIITKVPEAAIERRKILRPCRKEIFVTQTFFGGYPALGIGGASGAGILNGAGPILQLGQTVTACHG